MKVVCFYWWGDRWQTTDYVDPQGHTNLQSSNLRALGHVTEDLPVRYINNLYRGVKRFAPKDMDFQFILYTNEQMPELRAGIEVRPLPMITKHGVLPRLYMFSREAGLFGHQVLCLDIDVVVVGDLSDIIGYDGLFCARSKFKPGEEWKLDGDIMSFQAGEETERMFWQPFVADVDAAVKLTQGRERYWFRHVANDVADRWEIVAPGQIVSYKRHVNYNPVFRQGGIPDPVRIVSCHGVPRPHQIAGLVNNNRKCRWIKGYWK